MSDMNFKVGLGCWRQVLGVGVFEVELQDVVQVLRDVGESSPVGVEPVLEILKEAIVGYC